VCQRPEEFEGHNLRQRNAAPNPYIDAMCSSPAGQQAANAIFGAQPEMMMPKYEIVRLCPVFTTFAAVAWNYLQQGRGQGSGRTGGHHALAHAHILSAYQLPVQWRSNSAHCAAELQLDQDLS
jgi:hypothetical protein